jgi:transcriptional regulator with XRE-family HTH domain
MVNVPYVESGNVPGTWSYEGQARLTGNRKYRCDALA